MKARHIAVVGALLIASALALHFRVQYQNTRYQWVQSAIQADRDMLSLRIEDHRRQMKYASSVLMSGGSCEGRNWKFMAELHVHLPTGQADRGEALAFLE